MNNKLMSKVRKLHRWLALIVGIQLFIWTASGLYMTAMPLYMVHGKHLISKVEEQPIGNAQQFFPISSISALHPDAISIELKNLANEPLYLVTASTKKYIYDALTGKLKQPVSEQKAQQIAKSRYTGQAKVSSVIKIEDRTQAPEIGGRATPIWQVNFDDMVNTSIYVSTSVEKVETVRSDIWRVFDFFWMLHIMDYSERENFNNPLVIFMSTLGCFIGLSGILLFVSGWQKSKRFLR